MRMRRWFETTLYLLLVAAFCVWGVAVNRVVREHLARVPEPVSVPEPDVPTSPPAFTFRNSFELNDSTDLLLSVESYTAPAMTLSEGGTLTLVNKNKKACALKVNEKCVINGEGKVIP